MTKIVLQDTNSGYNLSKINSNFDVIEEFINDKVLSRDNPTGDANQMVQTLDMNGQRIINLPAPTTMNEPARVQDLLNASIGILPILPATLINVAPGHGIASTNVQSALYELADDTTALTTSLASEVSARTTAVTNEAATRATTDTGLQTSINGLTSTVNSHTSQIAAFNIPSTILTVSNINGLRAVNKTINQRIRTLGYYAGADGGNGEYYCDLSDTTSADNGGSIIVASDGGRWRLYQATPMTSKQWGCKADGVTDDWFFLQRALNNSTKLNLSEGTHAITNTLSISKDNTTIAGTGINSRITTNHPTADILTSITGSQVLNLLLKDFSIDSSVAKSAGWAINTFQSSRTHIQNISMSPPELVPATPNLKHGIWFNQFDYCTVDACTIIVSGTGVKANGNSSSLFGAGLFISGGTKIFTNNVSGSIGVQLAGGAGGVVFGAVDIIGCENNVQIDVSVVSAPNREIFFTASCTVDSAGFSGINVLPNSGSVLDISGTWIASSGQTNATGSGLLIQSPNASLYSQVSGARFFNNGGGGIISNAGVMVINGGLYRVNGKGASGGHGISFPTANTMGITITGAQVIDNGTASVGFGIFIQSGVTNTNIQCNSVRNNAQGQIGDSSGAVNKLIANNLTT